MIEFDEYKVKLTGLKPKLDDLAVSLNLEADKEELERLHAQIDSPGFWDNQEVSQKVMKRTRQLEAKDERYNKMCAAWDDLMTICEMALEENDDSMLEELTAGYEDLEKSMEEARLETLLTGEYDNSNALLSFHAGAAVPRHRTGARCSTACIPAGQSATASATRFSTIWTVTKQA